MVLKCLCLRSLFAFLVVFVSGLLLIGDFSCSEINFMTGAGRGP